MNDWYKNPTVLIVAGIGIFAAFILMRNQSANTQATATSNSNEPTTTTDPSQTNMNPVGGSYSYLDGSGMQHMVATDPYGNLLGYNTLPPGTSQPQPNEMSTYVGMMNGQYVSSPYYGTTPYFSLFQPTTVDTSVGTTSDQLSQ